MNGVTRTKLNSSPAAIVSVEVSGTVKAPFFARVIEVPRSTLALNDEAIAVLQIEAKKVYLILNLVTTSMTLKIIGLYSFSATICFSCIAHFFFKKKWHAP